VTLKEKQPLSLKSRVYSTLQEGQVKVKFEDLDYYIFCVVNTLCQVMHTTTPIITPTTTSTEVTEKTNVMIIVVITISVVIVLVLLILIALCVVANKQQLRKHKQKPKHVTINPQTFHMGNSIQLTSSDKSRNERPSTSSNDTGFISDYNESGSPCSVGSVGPFSSPITHSTDNSNINLPNNTSITNSAVPAVTCTLPTGNSNTNETAITHPVSAIKLNPVRTKHKMNSVSEHHDNTQLRNESHVHNIRWSNNAIYSLVNPCKTTTTTASKSSVTGKEERHFYDDVEDFRIQRAAKSTTNYSGIQYPPSVHYSHSISPAYNNVTINRNETLSLPMTNHSYKNVSLSQV